MIQQEFCIHGGGKVSLFGNLSFEESKNIENKFIVCNKENSIIFVDKFE